MLEKLKDLEQEVMDELTPEEYESITSTVLDDYKRPLYLAGYLDGLQTAIRLASEQSEDLSYTLEMDDIFDDEDLNTN